MRRTPARPPLRATRGAIAGTVCGLGAVVAHQVAGGTVPHWSAALIWPASVLLCTWLVTRGGLSVTRAVLAAAAAQLGWHLIMALPGTGSGMSGMHHPGMAHHDMALGMSHEMGGMQPGMSGADPMTHSGSDHSMLIAHAVVALVTVVVCQGADRAVLGMLIEWLTPLHASIRLRLLVLQRPPALRDRSTPALRPAPSPATRRGPPLALV